MLVFSRSCCKLAIIMASESTFWNLGHQITGHKLEGSLTMGFRKFRAFFGTSPEICLIVWNMLSTERPSNSMPQHLLWSLMVLKRYHIESVSAALVGVTEKTFRKWSLLYIRLIANLSVVSKIVKGEQKVGLTVMLSTRLLA